MQVKLRRFALWSVICAVKNYTDFLGTADHGVRWHPETLRTESRLNQHRGVSSSITSYGPTGGGCENPLPAAHRAVHRKLSVLCANCLWRWLQTGLFLGTEPRAPRSPSCDSKASPGELSLQLWGHWASLQGGDPAVDLEKRGKVTPECRRAWGHGTSLLYEPMLFSIPTSWVSLVCSSCRNSFLLGTGPQPRHVPWLGIELATLWLVGRNSIHWATPARVRNSFLKTLIKDYNRKFWLYFQKKMIKSHFEIC